MLCALAASSLGFHLAPRSPHHFAPVVLRRATLATMGRKPGVSEPEELAKFVADAGDKLIVLDVRNP